MSKVKSISISDYVKIGTSCLVCGEFVELPGLERAPKICPECIKAIKFAKRIMKNNPNMNIEDDIK